MEQTIKGKYAILLYPSIAFFPKDNSEPFDFGNNRRLVTQPIASTLEPGTHEHWKDWLGELQWDELSRRSIQIQAWIPSELPDVLDSENQILTRRVEAFMMALMLMELVLPPPNKPFVLTGAAEMRSGKVIPQDIRQFTTLNHWWQGSYVGTDEYRDSQFWAQYRDTSGYPKHFFKKWGELASKVEEINSDKKLLIPQMALLSFHNALTEKLLDFKFPNLTRAVETVIGLNVNQGANIFAERSKQLLPDRGTLALKYDGSEPVKILESSYDLRSDCVHGKPFAWSLEKLKGQAEFKNIHRYEYLLETAARQAVKFALINEAWKMASVDRDTLESAWASKQIAPRKY